MNVPDEFPCDEHHGANHCDAEFIYAMYQDHPDGTNSEEWRNDLDRLIRIAVADTVWATLEARPGFNEELAQARCDIESGHGTYLADLQRR